MTLTWQGFVANLAIVALVAAAWSQCLLWFDAHARLTRRGLTGLVVGLGAVLAMVMAIELRPGVIFDLRVSIIAVGAFFGGPMVALIGAGIAAIYRASVGGPGALLGIAALYAGAGVGLLTRLALGAPSPRLYAIVALGAAAAVVSTLTPLLLPAPIAAQAFSQVALPGAVMNFLATLMLALTIRMMREGARDSHILRAALAQAPDFQYVKNRSGAFVAANNALARHNGFLRPQDMLGKTDFDLLPPERASRLHAQEQDIIRTGVALKDLDELLVGPDGQERWYRTSKVPLLDREGLVIGLAGVTVDITAPKRLEHDLTEGRDLLAMALSEMNDGLAMFDADGKLVLCNDQYSRAFPLTGAMRRPGTPIRDILRAVVATGEQAQVPREAGEAWIEATAAAMGGANTEEVTLFNGRHLQIRTRPARNGNALVVVTDVTEIKEAEAALRKANAELEALASTDGLTGLPNRRAFDDCLRRELSRTGRAPGQVGLLLIDVDHFKAYNDVYGHLAGDDCLRSVADCLRRALRRPDDIAARFGGEEFAVILPGTDEDGTACVGEEFRRRLRERRIVHTGSDKGLVTASVGLCHIGSDAAGSDSADILGRADAALYEAKALGRDRLVRWRDAGAMVVRSA